MYKLLWQLLHVNDLQWFRAISHQHFTQQPPPPPKKKPTTNIRSWESEQPGSRGQESSSTALTAKHVSVLVVLPFLGVLFTLNSGNMLSRGTAHSLIRSASAGLNCKASLQTRGHFLFFKHKENPPSCWVGQDVRTCENRKLDQNEWNEAWVSVPRAVWSAVH